MTEDVAELEARPVEPKRGKTPDLSPARTNDDQPQQTDGKSSGRKAPEAILTVRAHGYMAGPDLLPLDAPSPSERAS